MSPIQKINVGAAVNDGTGDAARTAFEKTNDAMTAVDNLLTAAGLEQGDTNIGAYTEPDTSEWEAEDDIKLAVSRLRKSVDDIDVSSGGSVLTQNNAERSYIPITGSWVTRLATGFYTQLVASGSTEAAAYPYDPGSGSIRWKIHVKRETATTGYVEASAFYGERGGVQAYEHRWRSRLETVGDPITSWNIVRWTEDAPSLPTRPEKRFETAWYPFEVWLKIGQSNAVGVDHRKPDVDQTGLDLLGVDAYDPRVLEMSRGESREEYPKPAQFELYMQQEKSEDAGLNTLGPQHSFGKARVRMHPGIKRLAIINRAVGGTAMEEWVPGNGLGSSGGTQDRYGQSLFDLVQFLQVHPEYRFAGILFAQGESDAIAGRTQAQYEADVVSMVNGYRTTVRGGRSACFIYSTMSKTWRDVESDGATVAQKAAIDAAHRNLVNLIDRSAMVDMDDVLVEPINGLGAADSGSDVIHFGRDQTRVLGRRWATAAPAVVELTPATGLPTYRFLYDTGAGEFRNAHGLAGTIYNQALVNDAERGWVLDCTASTTTGGGFGSDMVVNLDGYTKSAWVKPTSAVGTANSIMTAGKNSDDAAVILTAGRVGHGNYSGSTGNTSFLNATTTVDDGGGPVTRTETFTLDTWVHLAATWDGTRWRCFINGIQTDQSPLTNVDEILTGIGRSEVGAWDLSSGFSWPGYMDDVRILPYALDPAYIPRLVTGS